MKLNFIFFVFCSLFILFFCLPTCFALENQNKIVTEQDYYNENIDNKDIKKLWDELPVQTKKHLESVGIDSLQWKNISNISYGAVFSKLTDISYENLQSPLFALFEIVVVVLITSLVQNTSLAMKNTNIEMVINFVSTICSCIIIISPILECIQDNMKAVKALSIFMLSYVPITVGILISLGKSASAMSYNLTMIGASEIIAQLSTNLFLPLMNVFLSISIVSSISPRLNFNGICNIIIKTVKWLLGIVMSIFITILSIQNIVNVAADNISSKAIKFAIGSFVPVVGSVLSEALGTIQGALHMMKSGIGAFGILGVIFLFAPGILKCLLWLIGVNLSMGISELFEIKQLSRMFSAVSKVLGLIVAVVLSCMMVFIISTLFVTNMK